MEVLEVLHSKLGMAKRFLKLFLDRYEEMDDTERLEKANVVLDELNSYLQIEGNLLFPLIERTGLHDDLIQRGRDIHDRIDNLAEHAVMMHVDEPQHAFYHDMAHLYELIEHAERIDHDAIFPWSRVYLTEADQLFITTHIKNQMLHESIPAIE